MFAMVLVLVPAAGILLCTFLTAGALTTTSDDTLPRLRWPAILLVCILGLAIMGLGFRALPQEFGVAGYSHRGPPLWVGIEFGAAMMGISCGNLVMIRTPSTLALVANAITPILYLPVTLGGVLIAAAADKPTGSSWAVAGLLPLLALAMFWLARQRAHQAAAASTNTAD